MAEELKQSEISKFAEMAVAGDPEALEINARLRKSALAVALSNNPDQIETITETTFAEIQKVISK